MQNYNVGNMTYPAAYIPPQVPFNQQPDQLRQFWQQQMNEIHQVDTDPAEFKNHQLPLARIKKVNLRSIHTPVILGPTQADNSICCSNFRRSSSN